MKTDLRQSVIYQIYLRTFTAEGTLKSAEKLIPHIADMGIDIICMSACNTEDTSVEGQSKRQIESGMNNVKNPYRIKDYFDVDEEYGTIENLKDFIDTAHKYGIKVLIDLVFLHCGTQAVFIEKNPDFVVRDKNGEIKIGDGWPFARLDYNNPKLREYMWSIMEFYIKDMEADGFRCDVGDTVPLDFWVEGVKRIKKINPDVIMLNEGEKLEWLEAFDVTYSNLLQATIHNVFIAAKENGDVSNVHDAYVTAKENGDMTALTFKNKLIEIYNEVPEGKFLLCTSENHDTASDFGASRPELYFGKECVEAIMALLFTLKGVPFIYNGCEVADCLEKSMFWNRFCEGGYSVQWQNALTDTGKSRIEYLKQLIKIRREDNAVHYGEIVWLDNDCEATIISYKKQTENDNTFVIVNVSPNTQTVHVDGIEPNKYILMKNANMADDKIVLEPYGVIITK